MYRKATETWKTKAHQTRYMLACFTWSSWGFILIGMWGSAEGSSAIYNALDAHRGCCNSWPTKGDRLREIDAFISRDSLYTMMVRLRTVWNIVSKKNSNLFNGLSWQERLSSWINLNLLPFTYSVVAVLRKLQNCAAASICNRDRRLKPPLTLTPRDRWHLIDCHEPVQSWNVLSVLAQCANIIFLFYRFPCFLHAFLIF